MSRFLLRLAVLVPALCGAGEALAAAAAGAPVEEVKAAFVVNFLRYTEWPATSFESAESPFVVTVIGSDGVADALEAIAERAETIGERPLTVQSRRLPGRGGWRWQRLIAELRGSHLVYLGAEIERENLAELLAALAEEAVLTVGDRPGFAASGGMIGLRRSGTRIVFDANTDAIKRTRLLVSARVLRLARIVGGGEGRS